MSIKPSVPHTLFFVAAAGAVCTLFAASAGAQHKSYAVTEAVHVNAQGLDLRRPADAQLLYVRLENAAWRVCMRSDRVDVVPVDNPVRCRAKSLADAVRSVNAPRLTQIFLENHTLKEAVALGLAPPVQLAAK